jgi:hypothetical protein
VYICHTVLNETDYFQAPSRLIKIVVRNTVFNLNFGGTDSEYFKIVGLSVVLYYQNLSCEWIFSDCWIIFCPYYLCVNSLIDMFRFLIKYCFVLPFVWPFHCYCA